MVMKTGRVFVTPYILNFVIEFSPRVAESILSYFQSRV